VQGEKRARQLREQSQEKRAASLAAGEPGLSLVDRALAFGAQTVWQSEAQQTLYSWTSTRSPALAALNPGRHRLDASPEQSARIVKRAARFYGALMVGAHREESRPLLRGSYGRNSRVEPGPRLQPRLPGAAHRVPRHIAAGCDR